MSNVLILIGAHLSAAPRAQKEAETLAAAGHEVTVRGLWFDAELADRDRDLMLNRSWRFDPIQDLRPGSLTNRSKKLAVRARRRLAHEAHVRFGKFTPSVLGYDVNATLEVALSAKADLTIVHSEAGLWVGEQLLELGMRVGVDFEDWFSEDLLPEARRTRPIKQLRALERRLMHECDYRLTTSQGMAKALAAAYDASPPTVVYNAFPAAPRQGIEGAIRDRRDPAIPSLHWFSQTIGPGRGLETLLASLNHVSVPAEIHLRGNCTEEVRRWLYDLAPLAWRERIFIHPTVSNGELLSRIAEHDIGLALEIPYCRNKQLTISNKLFQYLQAGLAVVATDTAGQREALFGSRAGRLAPPDDPLAIARALEDWLIHPGKLNEAKAAALRLFHQQFCWDRQAEKLLRAANYALTNRRQLAEASYA